MGDKPTMSLPDYSQREDRYLNRELELLQFQYRVLEEATNSKNRLLERVKFLAILASNLDEFFMVRVGGLVLLKRAGVVNRSIDGKTPAEQLAAIRPVTEDLMLKATQHWHEVLKPALDEAGIHVLNYSELNDKQLKQVTTFFNNTIFPVLTPQGFDLGHPFPHISNLSLNLAVMIEDRHQDVHFARVKVPSALPRLVPLKRSSGSERKDGTVPHHHWFVWLDQVIAAHLTALFPGNKILHAHPFHVIRNADIETQDIEASDLLETIAENLHIRRFSPVIKLAMAQDIPKESRRILADNLHVNKNDQYALPGPLAPNGLMQLYEIDRYDLKDKPATPRVPVTLRFDARDGDIYAAMRAGDILVHHPYDSFDPVIDFLATAIKDPQVLAIKQILYRVGQQSAIVDLLLKARREYRKQVTVLVELKARFDEESNISWARKLEQEGVHVIYGMVGLKTHAKTLMVIRQEGQNLIRYMHLGTGNYNSATARVYEDFGFFTSDPEIGADLTDLFNYLTGYAEIANFRKLMVAPLDMRRKFQALVQREIEHARQGQAAHLIFKCNALVDCKLIDQLYEASQAGVQIDLIIRGLCCLRAGLPGLSENIRVRSIVGRFLEHSRVYYFGNNGQPEIYLGSADLMTRNADHRVEVLFPIQSADMVRHLTEDVLKVYLRDNCSARIMQPDGSYTTAAPQSADNPLNIQSFFLRQGAESR